jgi:hypothetical protein
MGRSLLLLLDEPSTAHADGLVGDVLPFEYFGELSIRKRTGLGPVDPSESSGLIEICLGLYGSDKGQVVDAVMGDFGDASVAVDVAVKPIGVRHMILLPFEIFKTLQDVTQDRKCHPKYAMAATTVTHMAVASQSSITGTR